MRRREFLIGALGGATALLGPADAQPGPVRRLGILMVIPDRPVARSWVVAALETFRAAGWVEGQNLQVDLRFGTSAPDRIQRDAEELLGLKPDVVLAQGVVGAGVLQRLTTTVPVVFVQVQDPVGGGFVTNLARPDGNQTGFTNFDYAMMGKWLQLLKEAAPNLTRAMAIINPDNRTRWSGYSAALERFAAPLGLRPLMAGVHDPREIDRVLTSFAAEPGGGLVVLPDATTGDHASLIIELTSRHRLPAVFPYESQARAGGLVAYTSSVVDQYRGAASYIDRLFRGARIADLPVQAAERFQTILNLKTAKELGLTISPTLLASADEVIE